jgi:hypothetical protein
MKSSQMHARGIVQDFYGAWARGSETALHYGVRHGSKITITAVADMLANISKYVQSCERCSVSNQIFNRKMPCHQAMPLSLHLQPLSATINLAAVPILHLQRILSSMAFLITPNLRFLYVPTRLRSSDIGLITMRLRLTAADLVLPFLASLRRAFSSSDTSFESRSET